MNAKELILVKLNATSEFADIYSAGLTTGMSFGEIAEPSTAFFDKDDRIVIVDGPMKGMEGQITSVDRRKRRVKLVVTMFDTEMTLNLSYNLIEKKDS